MVGGYIEIIKHFARSGLRNMGFVKRTGMEIIKSLPSGFKNTKSELMRKVKNAMSELSAPYSLIIINWDQTSCQFVLGGLWTIG